MSEKGNGDKIIKPNFEHSGNEGKDQEEAAEVVKMPEKEEIKRKKLEKIKDTISRVQKKEEIRLPSHRDIELDLAKRELKIIANYKLITDQEKKQCKQKLKEKLDFIESVELVDKRELKEKSLAEEIDEQLTIEKNAHSDLLFFLPEEREVVLHDIEGNGVTKEVEIRAEFGFYEPSLTKKLYEKTLAKVIDSMGSDFIVEEVSLVDTSE